MRVLFGAALLLVLCACTDEVSDAQRELAIIENSGDPRQICDAHRKVADAYLKQQSEAEYRVADNTAKIYCRRASQEGY